MDDYYLVLSPGLDLRPAEIAEAWNEHEEAHALAIADLRESGSKSLDPATIDLLLTTASTIGVGVLTNALYDVLKSALLKKGKKQTHTKITLLTQPDQTRLLIIEQDEQA